MELFQKKIVSSFNLKIGREYPSIVFKIRSIVFKINLYKISCERSRIKVYFYFYSLYSTVIMGRQRHSSRRNDTFRRNFKSVSLLERKRLELSDSDRGFAESDRRGKSIAFRARDGGTARP